MNKTFSIISLGCPRNLVDSETIISEFKHRGYLLKEKPSGVDTIIVNTCAFIEDAKKESIDTILKVIDAKKEGEVKKIIVTGCLSQRYDKELKRELPEADEFRGVLDFKATFKIKPDLYLTPKHYAYIKVSEGCKNKCTYCIIPVLKGPYCSRPFESIIEEAKRLIQKGVKEIILVGQDTSLYGIDLYGKKRLPELLLALDKISKNIWIRLLYCHPANLDKGVINIISKTKNICKYIDLPMEHISDRILKRMGRRTKKKDIVSLVSYIRKKIPGVAIRTSLIVGFPGEREKDFQELLSFVKEAKFERLGLFMYSREDGTSAYNFKGQVAEKEKKRRFDAIMSLQQEISAKINENFKGGILKVLVEEKGKDFYMGRTEYDAPEVDGMVYVKGENLKFGNFYKMRITDTYEYDLTGELL